MSAAKSQKIVTLRVGDERFGLSIFAVRDMLHTQAVQPVPLAPASVAGLLNLRGKPVAALQMHARLGVRATQEPSIMVVVEYEQELVALLVDAVLDIVTVQGSDVHRVSNDPDAQWHGLVTGTLRSDEGTIHLLDLDRLLAA